jgi:N utilization substance protein B
MSIRNQRHKSRQLLVQALYQWQIAQAPINEIIAEFLADNDEKKFDTDYFQEVLHGVNENVAELDECLNPFTKRPLKDLDPVELAILRLATFELVYKLEIPYRVVINEAIELAKRYGATDGHKFVNGVLDKTAQKIREVEFNTKK